MRGNRKHFASPLPVFADRAHQCYLQHGSPKQVAGRPHIQEGLHPKPYANTWLMSCISGKLRHVSCGRHRQWTFPAHVACPLFMLICEHWAYLLVCQGRAMQGHFRMAGGHRPSRSRGYLCVNPTWALMRNLRRECLLAWQAGKDQAGRGATNV